jgi:oligoendopeptidase F
MNAPADNLAAELGVADIAWDLTGLTGSDDPAAVTALLDAADAKADAMQRHRGTIATLDGPAFAVVMHELAELTESLERAGTRTMLDYATDVSDPVSGAAVARLQERGTAIGNQVMFVELEWAAVDEAHASEVMADPALAFCAHHLKVVRLARPFLLTEAEERINAEKNVTGVAAWTRLFDEQLSAVTVDLGGERSASSLEVALSELQHPDRERRKLAADAITVGLAPGLRTRAYIYNTLLAEKSTDDRLRSYATWVSSRNLANQASDASVRALVDAVTDRFDVPQRWYRLKAQILGVERLSFYDRNAALSTGDEPSLIGWDEARATVLDAFASFSPRIADTARRFFDENWIDAPPRAAKQGGAFCAPTVPGLNPYVMVNFTGTRNDVLTLAHELGHGVHFALSGEANSVFELQTPLTVAETASVFGETVTFGRLLDAETDARRRLMLLGSNIDASIATVFRQVAMWRFEDLCHTTRRTDGELSVDTFNELWLRSQNELFGATVDTTGYESWWSYIHHFVHVPGYVYAYAFGQLLALSVYERYTHVGPSFVPRYEAMLAAGGSRTPEALAMMVDCDLTDPEFWSAGLSLIDRRLAEAEEAAAVVATL